MIIKQNHNYFSLTIVFSIGFLTLALVSGCGEADLPPGLTKKAVQINEVPEPIRVAAKKAISGVDFNEAWENLDSQGHLHSYEIRGRKASDGKIREVRVSTSGEILESE
jgi:hypothetical protein